MVARKPAEPLTASFAPRTPFCRQCALSDRKLCKLNYLNREAAPRSLHNSLRPARVREIVQRLDHVFPVKPPSTRAGEEELFRWAGCCNLLDGWRVTMRDVGGWRTKLWVV